MPRFVQGVEVNKEIPVNAEIKVGHFYRKNSYGDTDVFRRLTYWDPDTGYKTSCGSKKIGTLQAHLWVDPAPNGRFGSGI